MRALATAGAAALLSLGAGCDDGGGKAQPEPPRPGVGRSNAVTAPSGAQAAGAGAQTAGAGAGAATKPAAAPRQICVGQSPKAVPTAALSTAAAPGAAALPAGPGFGVGKWVWVNFWAAWCKPCKEEMPRLLGWQQKLRTAGVLIDLAFISIDDDERQLQRFLQDQPGHGVRASYWLPDGAGRTSWMKGLELPETPDLPVHAIVAPGGQVTCMIRGAVEDSDYPAVAAFLGAK